MMDTSLANRILRDGGPTVFVTFGARRAEPTTRVGMVLMPTGLFVVLADQSLAPHRLQNRASLSCVSTPQLGQL